MTTHLFLPDTQVKEGVPMAHLRACGNLIAELKPDKIIHIGDHADMPSLSSYDKGKKSFEGRRYKKDIDAAQEGMRVLLDPLWELQGKQRKNKLKVYKPVQILTLGNHENRINRAVNDAAQFDGLISTKDLGFEEMGWNVIPFLQPVVVDGITYVHYVHNINSPSPISRAHLNAARKHCSVSCGHNPGFDYYVSPFKTKGRRIQCLIAGSFYMHDEEYKGPQGNEHWRGIVIKRNVVEGQYDPEFISIDSLLENWL